MAMIIITCETHDNSMYPAACSVLSDALLEPSSFWRGQKQRLGAHTWMGVLIKPWRRSIRAICNMINFLWPEACVIAHTSWKREAKKKQEEMQPFLCPGGWFYFERIWLVNKREKTLKLSKKINNDVEFMQTASEKLQTSCKSYNYYLLF